MIDEWIDGKRDGKVGRWMDDLRDGGCVERMVDE
jgi:hypothetical protein